MIGRLQSGRRYCLDLLLPFFFVDCLRQLTLQLARVWSMSRDVREQQWGLQSVLYTFRD